MNRENRLRRALVALLLVVQAGCCSNETDVEALSPDGRFLARAIVRNCGVRHPTQIVLFARRPAQDG